MNNKKIGITIIVLSVLILILLIFLRAKLVESYKSHLLGEDSGVCTHEGKTCPYESINRLLIPTIIGVSIIIIFFAIGVYLIFFDKSQKILKENQEKIVQTLENNKKQKDNEEKFQLILSALNDDERKIMTAVREQDGITQATLRIRTGLSKTKLSILLAGLEKKELIKKILKGKTNQVFLKMRI